MPAFTTFFSIAIVFASSSALAYPYADRIARANRRARSQRFPWRNPEVQPRDVFWTRFVLVGGVMIGLGASLIGVLRL